METPRRCKGLMERERGLLERKPLVLERKWKISERRFRRLDAHLVLLDLDVGHDQNDALVGCHLV